MNAVAEADFEVVGEEPFFAPASTDMIDGLLGQYNTMRAKVERVAAVMNGPDLAGALHYFAEYAGRNDRHLSASTVEQLFDLDGAIAHLNASYWSKAMRLTDVLDVMPQARRDEWHKQIMNPLGEKRSKYDADWITPPIPEFNDENVRSTLLSLLSQRERFFAERVDGIFRSLSKTHVTNAPEGFGRRMILANAIDGWGSTNTSTTGVINDLRCVIAKFMGRDEPKFDASSSVVRYAREQRRGEWVAVDGGAIRIRCYAVGTAHLEVHPDMAWRLNCVLAQLYPAAIPSQFRERPKKRLKQFQMIGRPLPFAVLSRLAQLAEARDPVSTPGYHDARWVLVPGCYDLRGGYGANEQVTAEAARVLQALGGTPVNAARWAFDYSPLPAIQEIVASGCIPDQKAHQFYPTPEKLARIAVDMAEIGDGHQVLEPSAGMGGLADLLPKDRTTCVEISGLHCKVLESKGHRVVWSDFLPWADGRVAEGRRFDRIVMNPPFSDGRWHAHTEQAAAMLGEGGRLVAILPASAKASGILPGFDCRWHGPYENEFAGTSVSVVILQADKSA